MNVAVVQNRCFKTSMTDVSIDGEDSSCEQVERNKKATPLFLEGHEGCISEKESPRNTQRPGSSNIPRWASLSLVGALDQPKHTRQKQHSIFKHDPHMLKRKCSQIDERQNISCININAANNTSSEDKKGMLVTLREESGHRYTETPNTSTYTEESQPSSNTFFMTDFHDIRTNYCTSDLDEIYNNIAKQDCIFSLQNIVKTCRVFVAGESPILEEIMINKDIMSATLNSHIFSVLNKKRIKATRLQTYTWPIIIRGCSTVIVGEKSCGKTLGFVVPLLSTILDTYQHISGRLPLGIGPLMVVVCSSWQSAKCAEEYVLGLLPADTTLKVMTAWGGCGSEEEISTGKHLLGGCDILLTTAPCLMRLLKGNGALWGGSSEGATTTLTRCCHLVVDDVDIVLKNFSLEIKQIMTIWVEERKTCARSDLELQAVLVSSKWTKLLSQLTHVLLPFFNPSIIISTPFEAAIATKVKSHINFVADETESLGFVTNLITASYSQKNMVFVRSDSVADMLGSMMKTVAIYCLVVNSTVYKGKLQQLVDEWHAMKNVTMIVSEPAEKALLYHDVSNAHAIFHLHVGSSLNTFTQRFGFMADNFVTDVEQKSVNCESYVIVPRFSFERTPEVWSELNRLCGNVTEKVKWHLLSKENEGLQKNNSTLCYHLKAYGSCLDESTCRFRHEIYLSDTAHNIPKTGKVTVEVMNVLNASRYFVHITEYQIKSDRQILDLSNHYHILRSALHQYYADSAHHEPLQFPEKDMLCALEDNGVWTRAQIVSVNYSKATCMLNVFLIDEGKEMTIQLSSAWVLPSHLAMIPQLITEVFLCCIQPLDQDREWTPQASKFVHDVFPNNKKSKFVGTIVLALGQSVWLNPLVEFSKIGNTYVQKKSLRGKMLAERFGMDNPSHMKNLLQLCSVAGMSLRHDDLCDQGWIEARNEALQKITNTGDNEELSSDTFTNGKIEMDKTNVESIEECSSNVFHHGDEMNMLPIHNMTLFHQDDAGQDHLPSTSLQSAHTTLSISYEQLPLHTEMEVKVIKLVSSEKFYVIREDKLQELDNLEGEIEKLHDYLESCEGETSGDKNQTSKPSIGTPCIAKFTDNKYYRGKIKAGEVNGSMTVFFVDHGETIKVSEWQVHACPGVWVKYMPGQAIRCTLAHLTIPPHLSQAATQAMMHLTDITDSWKVKALEVRKDDDGLIYVVELTDDALDSPLEMWKHLKHQYLARTDSKIMSDDRYETAELFNLSNIDDQEIADFLLGISGVKQQKTKKRKTVDIGHNTTAVEIVRNESMLPNSSSLSEFNCSTDLVQENSYQEQESKNISTNKRTESDSSKTKSYNSVPDVNKKDTGKEHIMTMKCAEHTYNKAEVKKTLKLRDKDQDVNRTMSSERHIFDMKCLGMPPLSAVDGVTQRLAPETSWSQKEETVHITIHLVGVEQYKCRMSSSHLLFMSILGDKFYALDEELCHEITSDSCVVSVLGISVSIILKKAVKGKWKSLLKNKIHHPWLRGQYQNLSSEDSSETEDYDDDWRKVINYNNELPRGGLPAGISDTDETTDTDGSVNSG